MQPWQLGIIFWTFVTCWAALHFLTNHLAAQRNPHCGSTHTSLDARLPFVPGFALFYMSGYPLGVIGYFFLMTSPHLARVLWGFLLLFGIGGLTYILYPCRVERREKIEVRDLSTYLLATFQGASKPYNTLPSMHVAYGLYSALAVLHFFHAGVGLLLLAWAAMVALSTLLTKQHTIVDGLAGVAVTLVAFGLVIL